MAGDVASATGVVIPEEIRKKHPALIELILASESMDDHERQYWVNLLPLMTDDQIQRLQNILENEKRQLAEIDRKYAGGGEGEMTEEERRAREAELAKHRAGKRKEEQAAQQKEQKEAENILEQIEEL